MGLSTSQLRAAWDPPCNSSAFVTVDLHGEGRVTVDRRIVDAVHALDACLRAWNYATRQADTGAYNCRQITGGGGYSLHAYGIALDINWQSNPYGPNLITDMPRGMVDDICAIRTNNGKRVWEWGGSWSGNKDAMHYEIDCTPADIATGIVGGPSAPPEQTEPQPGEITMFIAIDSVALCCLAGQVLFTFPDGQGYKQSIQGSPNVPQLVVGNETPMEARGEFYKQLLMQHVVAVGEG